MNVFKDRYGKRIFFSLIFAFILIVLLTLNMRHQITRYISEIITDVPDRFNATFKDLFEYVMFFNHIDSYMIWNTNWFQFILIFICPISGILFSRRLKTIFKLEMSRSKNKNKFIRSKVIEYSCYVSFGIYIGYLLFYIIGCFICSVDMEMNYRTLFFDVLGADFYFNHRQIYWLLEGTTRFLFVPMVYTSFSCMLALAVQKTFLIYFMPILYWFGGTVIGYFATYFAPNHYFYFSPSLIMASGGQEVSTLPVFIPHFIVLFISFSIYQWAKRKYEF